MSDRLLFKLKIDSGDEDMYTPGVVARMLKEVAAKVGDTSISGGDQDLGGKVMDRNGNSVGEWELHVS